MCLSIQGCPFNAATRPLLVQNPEIEETPNEKIRMIKGERQINGFVETRSLGPYRNVNNSG
jgi:hypothetical protein